jgi:mRNA interferase RelE/StbE
LGYKVILSPEAAKLFRKLDSTVQRRVATLVDKIEASINPRFSGKALVGQDNQWRYCVGDYRLICEIQDQQLVVWVVQLGHRRDVYK